MKKRLVVLLIVLVVLLSGCKDVQVGRVCKMLGYQDYYVDDLSTPSLYYCIDTPKKGEIGRIILLPDNFDDITVTDWALE